jgi:hypothetical protein
MNNHEGEDLSLRPIQRRLRGASAGWGANAAVILTSSLFFLLLFLAACTDAPVLPTRAVPAVLPPALLNPSQPGRGHDTGLVPATWTPAPATVNSRPPDAFQPLAPTRTPMPTGIVPTSTPVPPSRTPTPDSTETATPYVSFIPVLPPSNRLGPSKMGLHVVRNNDPAIMAFVRQAQPAVMKAVDDLGFLAEVKAASPRTTTIGRINDEYQSYSGNPEEAARRYVAQNLEKFRLNPAVDYWEGWNEPDPNIANMTWYSRFEQERVRQMARHGFKAAIGGFPTGVPELDEFELFLPAIDVALQHRGILTLHEYGAPEMTYLYGSALPGMPAYPDRGALTFRYRWFYREILEPAGMVIPLAITEAGIDGIIGNRPGPQGYGWHDFQDYWVQRGWGPNGVQAFINQLNWYDNGVREDGYVIGFTVFTAGGIDHWLNYDVNPILPELTHYVIGQRQR